jgi:predicted Co/Zn/Cd cation transporter (cation efflux family)
MSLPFQIGLGAGLAVAIGLRPFLPAFIAGAFGSGAILSVSFAHGDYAFLQRGWFLATLVALFVAAWLAQGLLGQERFQAGIAGWLLAAASVALAALYFGGVLCDHGHPAWPGFVGGAVLAVGVQLATRGLLARVIARLTDRTARELLSVYLDGAALLVAALTLVLKPLGYVAVVAVLYLLIVSRRRGESKYAGLRILR